MSAKRRYSAKDRMIAHLVLVAVLGMVAMGAVALYATGIFDPVQADDALLGTEPLDLATPPAPKGLINWLFASASAEASPEPSQSEEPSPEPTEEIDLETLLAQIVAEDRGEGEIPESERVKMDKKDLALNPNLPDDWFNVLLLATDGRDIRTQNGRTDVMIVASMNPATGELKLSSLARDLYVPIPNNVGGNRINAAYAFGGPMLAVKTVNQNFELNIEHYVVVNFATMANIVDALGGVDIQMTSERECQELNYNVAVAEDYEGFAKSASRRSLTAADAGTVVHLDGLQAVGYARIRKIDNDLQRASRQRILLMTMMDKVMENATLSTIVSLTQSMMPNTLTNLPITKIMEIGGEMIKAETLTMTELSLPIDGSYHFSVEKDKRGTDMEVISFSMSANVTALHEFIYGQYIPAVEKK